MNEAAIRYEIDEITEILNENQDSNKVILFEVKKYLIFAVRVIDLVRRYFFKDGVFYFPKILYFWIYARFIKELYNILKELQNGRISENA